MRILVLSDTHRDTGKVERVLERHPDIVHVFFLGDVVGDMETAKFKFSDRIFHIVSGNCDYCSVYPSSAVEVILNTRIFYCHGHRHGVKSTTEHLKTAAREKCCSLALFGHTHCSLTAYDDGLYIVNPGSLSSPRDGSKPSYAIIDITKDGIMPSIMYL